MRSPVSKPNNWLVPNHPPPPPRGSIPRIISSEKNFLHSPDIHPQAIMSLPHNQSQTLQSHLAPDPLQGTRRRSTEFELQAALIPNKNKFEYQSPADLIRRIQTTIDSGSAEEYFLYFRGVTHDHLPDIDKEFFASQLPGRCTLLFTTENSLSGLIYRILPGRRHRDLRLNLWIKIMLKISSIPGHALESIDRFGGRRFDIKNVRSKEEHEALKPATQEERST